MYTSTASAQAEEPKCQVARATWADIYTKAAFHQVYTSFPANFMVDLNTHQWSLRVPQLYDIYPNRQMALHRNATGYTVTCDPTTGPAVSVKIVDQWFVIVNEHLIPIFTIDYAASFPANGQHVDVNHPYRSITSWHIRPRVESSQIGFIDVDAVFQVELHTLQF
jgi:hypothetical protein